MVSVGKMPAASTASLARARAGTLAKPKSRTFTQAIRPDPDVTGFQVAMHQLLVRVLQCKRNRARDL
jgi:hypothetical protein